MVRASFDIFDMTLTLNVKVKVVRLTQGLPKQKEDHRSITYRYQEIGL